MRISLPRILLHSDLHLESGPFTLRVPTSDPAVAVFAGDVQSGDGGPAALRELSDLPTVYVAGNHEMWGGDYFERLAQIKAQAKIHGIHFLENSAVVIHGVRFLGATLWTDYGGGQDALLNYGLWHMLDHRHITAKSWWSETNKTRFVRQFGAHALETFEGKFNPLLAMDLHRKTRAWLHRELAKPFDGLTVVVTHHAPAFESLLRSGVPAYALRKEVWVRRMNDDLQLTKVGSYASDLLSDLVPSLGHAGVCLWAHGHLHHAMRYGVHGIQVATNPRGRVFPPLDRESARAFSLLGYGVSDEEIERSQQAYKDNPERGDGLGYDPNLVLDLNESGYQVLAPEHAEALAIVSAKLNELKALRPLARSQRQAVADLAGYRVDALAQAALTAVKQLAQSMSAQFGRKTARMPDELRWVMLDCSLGTFSETTRLWHTTSSYDATLRWRETAQERVETERELFGWDPDQYSAANHLRRAEVQLKLLMTFLRRVPAACRTLHKAYLAPHNEFRTRSPAPDWPTSQAPR